MPCIRFLSFGLLAFLFLGCAAKQEGVKQDARQADSPVTVIAKARSESGAFCLIKPADGPVLSAYGMRRHPTKKVRKFHPGVDIAAKRGSAVVAAAGGAVIFSGRRKGYGNTVEIDHGNGKCTLYAHMDRVFVSTGQTVAQGEKLGVVGRSGRTTGPNLHFELLANGRAVNPVPGEGWAAAPLTREAGRAGEDIQTPPPAARPTVPAPQKKLSRPLAELDSPQAAAPPEEAPVNPDIA